MKQCVLIICISALLCSSAYPAQSSKTHNPTNIRLIGVEKRTSAKGISIKTQPASDKVIFHFDLKKWGKGTLRVSDTWGKLLLEQEIKDWDIAVNLHNAVPGVYSIILEKEHQLEVVEIWKE